MDICYKSQFEPNHKEISNNYEIDNYENLRKQALREEGLGRE